MIRCQEKKFNSSKLFECKEIFRTIELAVICSGSVQVIFK